MSRGIRYTDEFKQEAVNQVVNHGYAVLEVSKRLGISNKSLYDWIKKFSKPQKVREEESAIGTLLSSDGPGYAWCDRPLIGEAV